ncbi:MAG: hypothetical protein COV46_04315 [Deltaproteobacteria bacterium CG11_big_fil_rev_8_21_14_0_20_49_13]|nr:MAG: hypothetical protein COV46_04315 [Deltaproteobacteria bacterium CG11_big_fil_rev_8_21_14_0_20_49_13]
MINIKTMPKDAAAEILRYLAEHEDLHSLEKVTGEELTSVEVKALLREIADQLTIEAAAETKGAFNVRGDKTLSKNAKNVISCLSPREEKRFLSAFGLIDPSTCRPDDRRARDR